MEVHTCVGKEAASYEVVSNKLRLDQLTRHLELEELYSSMKTSNALFYTAAVVQRERNEMWIIFCDI